MSPAASPGTRSVALKTALFQTANVLSLAIVFPVSCLTDDLSPLIVFGITEVFYLAAASLWKPFRELLARRPPAEDSLDLVLLGVSVAGLVVISFFGFGKHLMTNRFTTLTHAEGWEGGAILWTTLFGFYYLLKARMTKRLELEKFFVIGFGAFGGWLLWRAWHSMKMPTEHLEYLLWIAVVFATIDLLQFSIYRRPGEPDPKNEKGRSWLSFWWADLPMLLSFFILWGYLKIHTDAEDPKVFVSGVVACQLLFSNTVFVVMEFAFLQPPKEPSPDSDPKGSDLRPAIDGRLGTAAPSAAPAAE